MAVIVDAIPQNPNYTNRMKCVLDYFNFFLLQLMS